MGKLEESLKWLGIDSAALRPLREQTYDELVRIASAEKRPVVAREIAESMDISSRTVRQHLEDLRKAGRVDWITAKGWVPFK